MRREWQKRIRAGERPVWLGVFLNSISPLSKSPHLTFPVGATLEMRCFSDLIAASACPLDLVLQPHLGTERERG